MKVDYFAAPEAKALVVDDFPINLEVAKEMLAPYQIKVYCAISGKQAVRLIQEAKTRYDIVFMDHMMPEMDGLETVKTIRGLDGDYARNLPIVALTACADESQADTFLNNGFQAFLTKPIDPQKMNGVLRKWLADKTENAPAPPADAPEPEQGRPVGALNKALTLLFAHGRVGGVNLVEAADRYNDADAYARVLDTFKRNTGKQVLELLRSRQDLPNCAILAHGIKSGCYGIGALDAGKVAESIEGAAKQSDSDAVSRLLVPFANQMEQLLADLEQLIEQIEHVRIEHTSGTLPEPSAASLRALLDAAANYDAAKMRQVMEQLDTFGYEADEALIKWLRQKVSDFNYDAICERLTKHLAE